MSLDKPFKDLKDQIEILKKRKIIINNDDYAKKILSNVSYYTLINGYKDIFIHDDSNIFIDGVSIEMLFQIHLIDLEIHSFLLKYIIHLERSFKSKLSYFVAQNFGVETDYSSDRVDTNNDYLGEINYRNTNRRRLNTLKKLKRDIIECKPNTTTKHYKETKNHVPPWILVNDIPLGRTIEWYKILHTGNQDVLAVQMIDFNNAISKNTRRFILVRCMELLRDYRNKIAHGNRTFSALVGTKLPKDEIKELIGDRLVLDEYKDKNMNDFFAVIIAMSILINDASVYQLFAQDLLSILKKYNTLDFAGKNIYDIFHIPNDIGFRLDSLYRRRMNSN